jgi:NADPH-dependent 2,4-dienoyl-CoA reductase/sulfur reductase-like enzyme
VVRTSVPAILAAGDGAGVAGSAVAVDEGRLAGILAAQDLGRLSAAEAARRAAPVRARLRRLARFRAALEALYPVGAGVYELWKPETVVCRCEEVTAREIVDSILAESADPNAVKNITRAGMGQCQGRNCARQVASIVARHAGRTISEVPIFTPRPPARPVPIHAIAQEQAEEEPLAEVG